MRTYRNQMTSEDQPCFRPVKVRDIVLILVAVMALGPAAFAQSTRPASKPAPPELELLQNASCLIKVTCDPAILPLSEDALQALLSSTGVTRQAWREVLGEFCPSGEPDKGTLTVTFTLLNDSGQATSRPAGANPALTFVPNTIMGRLEVMSLEYGGAVEIMAHVCARLQAVLDEAYIGNQDQLDEQLNIATKEMIDAARELRESQEYRSKWCAENGRNDLSRESLLNQSNELEKVKQRLEMEVAGLQARRDALQQRIAEIGKRATASAPEKDPMVLALKFKLQAMQKQLQILRQKREVVAGDKYSEYDKEVAIVEAEAALDQHIQKATAAAGGESMARLNDELADAAIETTQKLAQLEQVRKQLKTISDVLTRADDYELKVDVMLPLVKQAYQAAWARREEMARVIRALRQPVVTVIGGTK